MTSASEIPGLSTAQVNERIAAGRRNAAPPASARSTWDIARDNVFNLFNVVLFGTLGALFIASRFFPNTRGVVAGDSLFTAGTVLFNIVIGVIQELRAKRALDQLAALSIRSAKVRRDGRAVDLPVDEIVQDDVIELGPGDRIPVDGPVIQTHSLEIDESLLTGEADNITKKVDETLLSGTFCVAGSGLMRADKIGPDSYANKLTATARVVKAQLTPLQQKINAVIQFLVVIMVIVAALQFAQLLTVPDPGGRIVEVLRYVLVIVASFVPAGLILAITLSLSFGAVRISRFDTLVQRLNAVESMGNVTVLCVDKTGTLTRNLLVTQTIEPVAGESLDEARKLIAVYTRLASAKNKSAQAMEDYVNAVPPLTVTLVGEVPFSSARKWGAVSAREQDGRTYSVLVGSPELLFSPEQRAQLAAHIAIYTRQALRVLAIATSPVVADGTETTLDALKSRSPVGLVVIRDEIRPDIVDTVREFTGLGVRIKVISGDGPGTVQAIAQRAGIPYEHVITQQELADLDEGAFAAAANTNTIFARIVPETKRRLIAALTRSGEYVAMVGDGVNDVPALKQARLGIAMNDGAQITKDVSDLVLLQNNLSALPKALREGQDISQKILASAQLYLSKNVLTILGIVFAGFIGLGFPTSPRLISWVTFITINVPCLFLAFGWIRPGYTRGFLDGVLGYAGLVGLIGSLIAMMSSLIAYGHHFDTRTMQVAFGLTNLHFGLHVFLDVHNASVWSPSSWRKYPRVMMLGLLLAVVGLTLPLAFPFAFAAAGASNLGPIEWAGIVLLPPIGMLVVRRLMTGRVVRRLARAISQ